MSTLLTRRVFIILATFVILRMYSMAMCGGTVAILEYKIGDTFNLSCPKANCSNTNNMTFRIELIGRSLSPTYNTNDSVIYTVENANAQKNTYFCMCGNTIQRYYKVNVGRPPQDVTEFSCIAYDFTYMNCSFLLHNPNIFTEYNLTYFELPNEANNIFTQYYLTNFILPNETNNFTQYNLTKSAYSNKPKTVNCKGEAKKGYCYINEICYNCNMSCLLDMKNSLDYRIKRNSFVINPFEYMILDIPRKNLFLVNSTTNAICVKWEWGISRHFLHKMLWDVVVTPKHKSMISYDHWRPINTIGMDMILCVDKLPFIGYEYELQVRVRIKMSKIKEWSQPMIYNFKTAEDRPAAPPQLCNGSFYVDSSETQLDLYWQELEPENYNGKNISYEISEYRINGKLMNTTNLNVTMHSAVIDNWQMDAKYEFQIRSRNRIGASLETSRLVIEPMSSDDFRARIPLNIRSVYHSNNESYMLSWQPPKLNSVADFLGYTVYWCNAKQMKLTNCVGGISFEKLNSSVKSYSRRSNGQIINLAVSADYERLNTGMHWPICTMDSTSDLARMEPTIHEATSTTLLVHWGTEHVCPAILMAYNLTYCKWTETETKEKDCITEVIDKYEKSYLINDLQPYTNYSVRMLMYSSTKTSKDSEALITRTAEAAPTPPQNLTVTSVTSNSTQLEWVAPQLTHGIIRCYVVLINGTTYKDINLGNITSYQLNDLEPYTNYSVQLLAKTLFYSKPSNEIFFTTEVSRPSQPVGVKLHQNKTTVISWLPPRKPAGKLDYYEVRITELNAANTLLRRHTSLVPKGRGDICELRNPQCRTSHRYTYEVRAVNLEQFNVRHAHNTPNHDELTNFGAEHTKLQCLQHSEEYAILSALKDHDLPVASAWERHNWQCSTNDLSQLTFSVVATFSFIVAILYSIYALYCKCMARAKIGCTLPNGYEAIYIKAVSNPLCDTTLGLMIMPKFNNENQSLMHAICTDNDKTEELKRLNSQDSQESQESQSSHNLTESTDYVNGHITTKDEPNPNSYLRMNSINSVETTTSQKISMNVSNNKPNIDLNFKLNTNAANSGYIKVSTSNSNYIQPTVILLQNDTNLEKTTNDYVTIDFQKMPTNMNGYIQMKNLKFTNVISEKQGIDK